MNLGGYSMTGVEYFNTPRGVGYNANILFDDEKICEVHDAGMGGAPHIEWFIDGNDEKCMANRDYHELILSEWFLSDIIRTFEHEESFLELRKKHPNGFLVYVCIKNEYPRDLSFERGKSLTNNEIEEGIKKQIPKDSVDYIRIYREPEDFIIFYPEEDDLLELAADLEHAFHCRNDDGGKSREVDLIELNLLESKDLETLRSDLIEKRLILKTEEKFSLHYDADRLLHLISLFEHNQKNRMFQNKGDQKEDD